MPHTLGGTDAVRIERSCDAQCDSIRFGPGASGIERAEVFLYSRGYEPHRHDTYGIGITIRGVQVFHYRGSLRVCLPGQLHVLHPDEMHDGGPGTDDGFSYRIMYIAPELIRDVCRSRMTIARFDTAADGAGCTRAGTDRLPPAAGHDPAA